METEITESPLEERRKGWKPIQVEARIPLGMKVTVGVLATITGIVVTLLASIGFQYIDPDARMSRLETRVGVLEDAFKMSNDVTDALLLDTCLTARSSGDPNRIRFLQAARLPCQRVLEKFQVEF